MWETLFASTLRVRLVVFLKSTSNIKSVFEEKSNFWKILESIFKKFEKKHIVLPGKALDR